MFSLMACGSKKIPKFDRPIFAFDERSCAFRYKYDVDVIGCSSDRAKGMIAFRPEDFDVFVATYIGQCKIWNEGTPLTTVDEVLKLQR